MIKLIAFLLATSALLIEAKAGFYADEDAGKPQKSLEGFPNSVLSRSLKDTGNRKKRQAPFDFGSLMSQLNGTIPNVDSFTRPDKWTEMLMSLIRGKRGRSLKSDFGSTGGVETAAASAASGTAGQAVNDEGAAVFAANDVASVGAAGTSEAETVGALAVSSVLSLGVDGASEAETVGASAATSVASQGALGANGALEAEASAASIAAGGVSTTG